MSAENTERPRMGRVDGRSVLDVLFCRAQGHLTADELEHLAGATDYAQEVARMAAVVANGVAGLVSADSETGENSVCAGNFSGNGSEVADLLWHLSGVFSHIDGLLSVGSQAAYWLDQQREQQGQ